MISDKMLPELKPYRELESNLPITHFPNLDSLVVYGGNDQKPIHSWFRFKEGYSADLLPYLLARHFRTTGRIEMLDPFCGSGTTLLSAQSQNRPRISSTGIERNPFIHFVANTKLSWHDVDPAELSRLANLVLRDIDDYEGPLPRLSSIRTGRCISIHITKRLLSVRKRLDAISSPYRDLLLLGLAACIEPLSKIRKDGRALRIVDRPSKHVIPLITRKWGEIVADIRACQVLVQQPEKAIIHLGDGRAPATVGIESQSTDFVLTSPPYPNNIDYSEVYKLELWLLGFITNEDDFLKLRKMTFRSHPTSDLAPSSSTFVREIESGPLKAYFEPLLCRLDGQKNLWRRNLVIGYFNDLQQSLAGQYKCLKPGGMAVLVVGNSLHGSSEFAFLVPTDILTACIGKSVGFNVEEIAVARTMKRRLMGNHFLRESMVVLRRPADC